MESNGLLNDLPPRKQPRSIFYLEVLCISAVAVLLAGVVTHSGSLTTSSSGGAYMLAMLLGVSGFMLSTALLLEQLKDNIPAEV